MAQPYHGGYHPTNDLSVILGQARAAEMIQAKLNQPDSFEIHPITGCLLSRLHLLGRGHCPVPLVTILGPPPPATFNHPLLRWTPL